MRPAPWSHLAPYRMSQPGAPMTDRQSAYDRFGYFEFMCHETSRMLRIVASIKFGWDHVSVSLRNKMPTWVEMSIVKDLFFLPEEAVMQLHPSKDQYVNQHPFTLHLWRPQQETIPLPPPYLVGLDKQTPQHIIDQLQILYPGVDIKGLIK